METVLQLLKNDFRVFGNQAISLVLVCAALLFWLAEQQRLNQKTAKLMKYVMLFFILTANPFGYNTIRTFWMTENYWKVFFVLVPVICISVPIVEIIAEAKRYWQKGVLAVACIGIVACSMNFLFVQNRLAIPQNANKVETEVAELDRLIQASGIRTINLIAPREVCAQIREIDENIKLMYGEDLIERMIDKTAVSEDEEEQRFIELCTTIVAVPSAVELQLQAADIYGGNSIILKTSYEDEAMMNQAGFFCYGRTEGYAVYFRA